MTVSSRRSSLGGAGRRILNEPVALILGAAAAMCVVVALAVGGSPLAAAAGSLLVLLYWLAERWTARLGERGSFNQALLVGFAGMVVRLVAVLAALIAIGVLWRAQFASAVAAFLATYTVYIFARLWRHPAVAGTHPRGGGAGG